MNKKKLYSIDYLIEIMNDLRTKCPWDQKQTLDSLKKLTIEETYELIDAIDKKNFNEIKEELGDLLLHIVFYSKIASEKKKFDFNDVIKTLIEKLISPSPKILIGEFVFFNTFLSTKVSGEISLSFSYNFEIVVKLIGINSRRNILLNPLNADNFLINGN